MSSAFINKIVVMIALLIICSVSDGFHRQLSRTYNRIDQISNIALDAVIRGKWLKEGIITQEDIERAKNHGENEESEHPQGLSLYPRNFQMKSRFNRANNLEDIDYDNLKVDDPIFLDMDWPTEAGPQATAFARHMAWRRQLADVERRRWQKWAVYQRIMPQESFQYCLDDYVYQNMLNDIIKRSTKHQKEGKESNAVVWQSVANAYNRDEELQINSTIKAYYSALNRKNFEDARVFWIPDDSAELTLPGYEPVVGHMNIEKFYRKQSIDMKYVGLITPRILSVDVFGYAAVVQTLEAIGQGNFFRIAKKRPGKSLSPNKMNLGDTNQQVPVKYVIATTILRKWNQQWRIQSHHATRLVHSTYTGNAKVYQPVTVKELSPANAILYGPNGKVMTKNEKRLASVNRVSELVKNIFGRASEKGMGSNKKNNEDYENFLKELNAKAEEFRNKFKQDEDNEDEEDDEDEDDDKVQEAPGKRPGGISVRHYLDFDANISKQTVLALRYLTKAGKMDREIKDLLMMRMIDAISEGYTSLIVMSFNILVNSVIRQKDKSNPSLFDERSIFSEKAIVELMDEFCAYCIDRYEEYLVEDGLGPKQMSWNTPHAMDTSSVDDIKYNIDVHDEASNSVPLIDDSSSKIDGTKSKRKPRTKVAKTETSKTALPSATSVESTKVKAEKKTKETKATSKKSSSQAIEVTTDSNKSNDLKESQKRILKRTRKEDPKIQYKVVENPSAKSDDASEEHQEIG